MDAKKAVHKHEKAMHPGKPLTKLRKGGKASEGMKNIAHNKGKVMKARQSSRGR